MIELCKSEEFILTLDPVEVEAQISSVSFNVAAEMTLSYQKASIEFQSCWIKIDALSGFENQLSELIQQKSGCVVLANFKQHPVITIKKDGGETDIIVEASDTMGYGNARIKVPGYADELVEMLGRLKAYPKFW
ncbi:hypothetical protein MNBD_GAMMA26-1625 [hydrothermal vent metagenome]|uniref:Uncharacterized protein n=1 Tax=hydrothermal vent metagenome TaxID=652676 RepID=A0A3B1B2B6_9ZZZZ